MVMRVDRGRRRRDLRLDTPKDSFVIDWTVWILMLLLKLLLLMLVAVMLMVTMLSLMTVMMVTTSVFLTKGAAHRETYAVESIHEIRTNVSNFEEAILKRPFFTATSLNMRGSCYSSRCKTFASCFPSEKSSSSFLLLVNMRISTSRGPLCFCLHSARNTQMAPNCD